MVNQDGDMATYLTIFFVTTIVVAARVYVDIKAGIRTMPAYRRSAFIFALIA